MKPTASLILAVSLLAPHILTPAQTVPPLLNCQGQLSDANGNPLPTADYALTFTIHDAAIGGSQVWGPQIFDGLGGLGHGPKIPVVQGFFNVLLGPVDTAGRSLADAFNASNRWVQTRVGNNAPIAPRQQVLSAPFALRAGFAQEAANAQAAANAQNAQNLEGRPAGAFVAKAGDTMTGRLNLPPDGLTVGGDQLVVSQGRVGVGVAPTYAGLEVSGNWDGGRPAVRLSGQKPTVLFAGGEEVGRVEWRQHLGAKGPGNLEFDNRKDAGDGVLVMALTPDGNVGIGTVYPTAKLEVNGDPQVAGTVNARKLLRRQADFSFAGTGTHGQQIVAPWGGFDDWNIFVLPREMGGEEPNSEHYNALLKVGCWATLRLPDRLEGRAGCPQPAAGLRGVLATAYSAVRVHRTRPGEAMTSWLRNCASVRPLNRGSRTRRAFGVVVGCTRKRITPL